MKKLIRIIYIVFSFFALQNLQAQEPANTPTDSIPNLPYTFTNDQTGSLFLNNPSEKEIFFDEETGEYIIVEKIGDYYISRPVYMTPEQYKAYRLKKDMLEYYKEKLNAVGGRTQSSKNAQKNLLPKYYIKSGLFESIFGGNEIEVDAQGAIDIRLGMLFQNVDNPLLSEQNRRSTTFDFNQEVSASLVAKIGTRLKVTTNYDTQSTFNFQNLIKLEYTPTEDDILQKIEVGNVSMPVKNSLVTGAQNLFGVKTQLQFGKTKVTSVFSEQKSQTRSVAAEGGSTINEFELVATDYDANRHFFLSGAFRDKYDNALQNFPLINSEINITKIEVWVTNRNANTTSNFRSIVALADLAEGNPVNIGPAAVTGANGSPFPSNNANDIGNPASANNILINGGPIRSVATVNTVLGAFAMQQGRDYSVLENAKQLQPNEYRLHPQLGYISLNRRLSDSEVLAVAYEYTVSGQPTVYKVGELSSDGVLAPDNLVVKLLRSEIINTNIPLWDLMMKNIYALGAYQMQQDGFRFEMLYKDDTTGQPVDRLQNAATPNIADRTLLNILDLDKLDQSQFATINGDGFFDYIEGITVNSEKGLIIFPVVEPFGSHISTILTSPADAIYIFDELYSLTQTQAKTEFQNKDKYLIKGYYRSENSNGIFLGPNVPQGAVKVTSGGRQLVEGVDFVVNYQVGRLQIINPSLISSNAPINISVESNSLFNLQTRRFTGVDIEHQFSENFAIGASLLNLREKPITQKAIFGSEPLNNTIFGFNTTFTSQVPKLTKWVNHLPNIDTDAVSNFSIRGDFAYLLPNTPKQIDLNGKATSYIDDFEGSQTPIDIKGVAQWYLASTPLNQSLSSSGLNFGNDNDPIALTYGEKRSKLAWYTIDQLFYGNSSLKPDNVDDTELSRAEVRRVNFAELFPEIDLDVTQTSIVRTLDLAYFPSERGPYNNSTSYANNSNLPEEGWAGITRALTTTDFQQANVEYIQFWIQDPYQNYSITNAEGLPTGIDPNDITNQVGKLYINLGNISEDVLRDNRKMYENGLPEDGIKTSSNTYTLPDTPWGFVPKNQSLLYAFADDQAARAHQDAGLDGANDAEEATIFTQFAANPDPAGDNYVHFRDGSYDTTNGSIISRYKAYNNTEGNTPTNPEFSGSSYPDVEDINRDQTMNSIESYYQYEISLDKADLVVGQNYIVDEKNINVPLEDGGNQTAHWLQFRVPIAVGEPINGISSFQSIRFMRMFLTKFKMPVVLRFGELQLVRGDWRRYTQTLPFSTLTNPNPLQTPLNVSQLSAFEVGVVNIQENEIRTPINYVLPPGVQREELRGSTTTQLQNEQSVSIKLTKLAPQETRAIFKNVSVDMRMFKNFEMFTHAENFTGLTDLVDGDFSAIVRLGSDLNDNYYQIEIPLKVTQGVGRLSPSEVWPDENQFEELLEQMAKLKLARFEDPAFAGNFNVLYPEYNPIAPPQRSVRVKGSPNLSNIKTIMLGVKNNAVVDKSGEVWFNEMRVSDFDNEGGWAAVVTADANFADFANFSATGRMETPGFGGIEQGVNERRQDEAKLYDIVASVNAGQLLPKKWGIKLPLNYSISEEIKDPKYDPQYQDIQFDQTTLNNSPNRNEGQDYTKRRSISLLNVRKERTNQEKKQRFYDVENVSVSYAYNETYHRDYNVKKYHDQNVRASAAYNYGFQPKVITPFKNAKFLKGKAFKFIKDFNLNLMPSNIGINTNVIRNYNQQLSRTLVSGLSDLPTLKQRNYLFDWDYNVAYDLTKSLQFTFNAANNNRYDEFNATEDVRLHDNFFNIGRKSHYHQTLNGSYKLPIDKLPLLNFVKANYTYTADFDWQAGPRQFNSITSSIENPVGNTIQNANTHNFTADLSLTKFYKNIGLDKLLLAKKKRKTNKKLPKGAKKPKQAPIRRTKKTKKKFKSIVYDVITSVKKVRLGYSENNGTLLPGYIPEVGFLGRDNFSGNLAPSLGFVFGGQYNDVLTNAVSNNWIIGRPTAADPYYNKTFSKTHLNKFDYNVSIKPFKNLDIELIGNKLYTKQLSQQIDVISGVLNQDSPISEVGNFSVTYGMIKTAFEDQDALFQKFKNYRTEISNRLFTNSGLTTNNFGLTSQDVMLPAFLAAYSGKTANTVKLQPFRDFPIPNWKLTYRGLMKRKWFKKNFRSFNISHGYRSSYVIAGFSNNLQYTENIAGVPDTDISGNYYTKRLFTSANLIEEFNPLVKVDVKLKNSFSFKGEIRTDRSLNLNFNNNTLTQISGKEYKIGLGYRIRDLKMKMRFGGKKNTFKGDLNIRADISLRDNLTVIRAVDTDNDQVTGGQRLFSIDVQADYAMTKNLTASFYFNQNASRYAISTTFPRKSIASGINIRYQFGN